MDVILLSEIEEKLNSVNTSLSNTLSTINTNVSSVKTDVSNVKTVCDNIYSKVDTEIASLLTNTNTNNTANLTGTLSQKLSYIANNLIGAVSQTGGTYNTGTVNAKLATILLNMDSTTFTAGTNIIKYAPINGTTTTISPTSTGWNSTYFDDYMYVSDQSTYSFKSNRTGTVRVSLTNTQQYGCSRLVISTSSSLSSYSDESYIVSSKGISTKSIETILDVNVTAGTTYYIHIVFCTTGYSVTTKTLKVSYNININPSLL